MAVIRWIKECESLPLYIVVTLTTFYFFVLLFTSYVTHSLTLTIDLYLMLCNLITLFGCIITIKVCEDRENENTYSPEPSICSCVESSKSDQSGNPSRKLHAECSDMKPIFNVNAKSLERRWKNTFGWARVDVLVMLISSVSFSSLCFSSIIEAVQTLLHNSHHDQMHHPIRVFCVGAFGLVLNGLCHLLIGGYTFHQGNGNCLQMTSAGIVVSNDNLETNDRQKLNYLRFRSNFRSSADAREICRDTIGCIFVMIVATIVCLTDEETAKMADPIASIMCATLLIILTYPYTRESCLVLLQTIPNHMDMDSLHKQLVGKFPAILNVHDLHVWQLTKDKIFLTAHIVFINPNSYVNVNKKIITYFREQGVTKISIQPEFYQDDNLNEIISYDDRCLIKCVSPDCYRRHCCDQIDLKQLANVCTHTLQM